MSDDEALEEVLAWLRKDYDHARYTGSENPATPHDLYVPTLATTILMRRRDQETATPGGMRYDRLDPRTNSAPLYAAAWELCRRGVLFPAPIWVDRINPHLTLPAGSAFDLTSNGRAWLVNTKDQVVPPENGRFGQLLDSHAHRFGPGYGPRSREALACYRAQNYLACCAMCGAAAESVLLALAIERKGDEAEVLKKYRQSGGRKYVEDLLKFGRTPVVQRDLETFASLLSYWRDDAAHGSESAIDEEQAFVAMMLLLKLAQIADDRWNEFTTP